jgi:hypothetical protein
MLPLVLSTPAGARVQAARASAHPAPRAAARSVTPSIPPVADGTRFHESGGSAEYISWFGASLPLSSSDARAYSAEGNKAVATVASGYVSTHPASDFPAHKAIRIVGSLSQFVDDGSAILPLTVANTSTCLHNLGQGQIAVVPDQWAHTLALGPQTECTATKSLGPFSLVQTYDPPSLGDDNFFDFAIGDNALVGDFNGDGRADELVYGPDIEPDALWYGTANGLELGPQITVNGDYEPVVGDFNGDGRADVFWYAADQGAASQAFASSMWLGRSGTAGFLQGPAIPTPPRSTFELGPNDHISVTHYTPLVGDFNADGKADLYFAIDETTEAKLPANVVWYGAVDGFTVGTKSTSPFTGTPDDIDGGPIPIPIPLTERAQRLDTIVSRVAPPSFHIAPSPLVGDYDGDGHDDLLWYLPGHTQLWRGAGTARGFTQASVPTVHGGYDAFVGDFNGDGKADVLWYGPGSSPDSLWRGTASGFTNGPSVTINGLYEPVVADYNGDGKADVMWYDPRAGHDHTWFGKASGFTHAPDSIAVPDSPDDISFPAAGDFNGDGHDDVLWWRDDVTETRTTFSIAVTAVLWRAH